MSQKESTSKVVPRDPNDKTVPNTLKRQIERPPTAQYEGCTSALTKFGKANQKLMPDPYPGMNRAPRRDEAAFTQHPFRDPATGEVICTRRQVFNTRTSTYVVSSETRIQ